MDYTNYKKHYATELAYLYFNKTGKLIKDVNSLDDSMLNLLLEEYFNYTI